MSKTSILIAVAAAFLISSTAAGRDKRQLAIGTISVSGAGGATGCVVTGNVLYANGIRLRNLTSDELNELETYQTAVENYKTELKEALSQRRDNLRNRLRGNRENGNDVDLTDSSLPKPPQKPTFCSAEETTQYYFDGCMVQGNKVYVGGQYARDLSSDEQAELRTFDTQQTAYQKALQAQMQSQVRGLFGSSDFLSKIFGVDSGFDGGFSQQQQQQQSQSQSQLIDPSTSTETSVTSTLPPKPQVPRFCTAIF